MAHLVIRLMACLATTMAPMGAGRGKTGADSEHRRPSYLIEMDDIFREAKQAS